MQAIQEGRKALLILKDVLEQKESKLKELQSEVTRKALVLQNLKEPDLADVPPAQRLVIPSDVIEEIYDENLTELEWNGTAGQKLTLITGLDHLTKLEHISFRSGFIRKPSGLEHCKNTLISLELYENRLRTLDGVQKLFLLKTLDISYNRLGRLEDEFLTPLTNLTKLYIAENKLSEIGTKALKPLVHLEILDLGGNNLRKIEGLETLTNLKELWLGKNKIVKIEGLDTLKSLVRLSLQSNRIVKMENLNGLLNLEELYLSDQGISLCEGIDSLIKLNTIDFTSNKLKTLEGLPMLPLLTDLWVANNLISSFEEVERLRPYLKLDTLVLERNPIFHQNQQQEYRKRIKEILPNLTYIDADSCDRV